MKKKRRHHYVWRHYLKSWASNEKIWCFREEKIFNSNLMGVAQQRDFYKIGKLTKEELEFVKKLIISPYCAEDAELNEGWLNMFQMGFEVEEQFKKHQPDNEKIHEIINIQLHNYEEDFHAQIENIGIEYIDLLLSKDTSFYQESEKSIEFLHFIALQYFRTKRIQNNVNSSVENISPINFENIWPILRHVYATQTAKSIYIEKENYKLVLLINKTGAPLITGDQPVINTHAVKDRLTKEVDKLEFYYPLSNDIALLITEEKKYNESKTYLLNFEEVAYYNKAIVKCSNEQVFSSCRESLEFFCE